MVCVGANRNLNRRKQIGENGDHREDRLRKPKVENHDAVQGAHQRHQGYGHCGMDKSEFEAFDQHKLVIDKS